MLQLVIGQLLNGVIVGTLYGIIALAVTLTSGITGIVNFVLGVYMMLGAYFAWYLTNSVNLPYPLAVVGAVILVAVIGLICDLLLFRHTRNNLINGLIVSLGLISVFVALVLMVWTTTPQNLKPILPGVLRFGDIVVPKTKLMMFGILLSVILLTYLSLTRTWIGRAAYAFAQNPEAAALMGVRTEILQAGVATYCAGLCGLGGALYASLYSISPEIGGLYILKGIEAAILAGVGSVIGALAGGIIIGVAEGVGAIFLPLAYNDAYGLVFLVLILLFRPQGLFGDHK